MRSATGMAATILLCVALYAVFASAITSPEMTAQYRAYTQAKTAIEQARQETQRVQAAQWGETARTWGMWGMGGLSAVAVVGIGGWAVVRWQEERSRRHASTETHTTRRHELTCDVLRLYITQVLGDNATARIETRNGVRGIADYSRRQWIPETTAAAWLDERGLLPVTASTALVRRTPQAIDVPGTGARRYLITGDTQEWGGEL